MKKWIVPLAAMLALTGCVSTATKTIDAQALGAVRNQSVVRTARAMPDFGEMTPAKATLGLIGAALIISEGNKTVAFNHIADPAESIAASLLNAMQSAHGMQVVAAPVRIDSEEPERIAGQAKGKARYVLDVRTLMWQMMYFPTDWTHYQVLYSVKARLIDVDTKNVVAEAFCSQKPDSNANAPTFDEMLALNAARLKAANAANAQACAASLGRNMLALQVPEHAPAAAATALAPAHVPAHSSDLAPAHSSDHAPVTASGDGNWKGVMACDARAGSGPRAEPYEARFAVEVQGSTVKVHRRTANVEETLSGQVEGDRLELLGTGHRVGEPVRPWRLAISGAFPSGATSYQGTGAMTVDGHKVRRCELRLTRT